MGISFKTLLRIIDLKQRGKLPPGSRMLELGAQNLYQMTPYELRIALSYLAPDKAELSDEFLAELGNGGPMSKLMSLCGIDYTAIDIFDYEATILFDLNSDRVPPELMGSFDLVTNLGTTEHVLDQRNSMTAIHDFTKVGGVMYHDVPMGGYYDHGYFLYTPMFFTHLGLANRYEVLFKYFSKAAAEQPYPDRISGEMADGGWPDLGYHNAGIEFVFEKTTADPFRLPVETGTSHNVNTDFLSSRSAPIAILKGAEAKNEP